MREIRTSGSMSGDGNGALPHGPSYRVHPRLYNRVELMRRSLRTRSHSGDHRLYPSRRAQPYSQLSSALTA